MEGPPKPKQSGIISIEAAIALVVAFVNLALDQADIHVMFISWISVIACIVLCIDVLRRTAWTTHPQHGRQRLTVGSSVIVIVFLSFGAFLSLHKKAIPGDIATHTAEVPIVPKAHNEPARESPATKRNISGLPRTQRSEAQNAKSSRSNPKIAEDLSLANCKPISGGGIGESVTTKLHQEEGATIVSFTTDGSKEQKIAFSRRPKRMLIEPPRQIIEVSNLPIRLRLGIYDNQAYTITVIALRDNGVIVDTSKAVVLTDGQVCGLSIRMTVLEAFP